MAAVGVKPISSSEKQTNNFRDNGRCYFKNLDLLKYGITRLADHTGLDEIGIPVWAVIRPDARSVSQCHGKGLTHDQAQISAVMEGIETALAETAEHRVEMIASANEMLRARRPIADFATLGFRHRTWTAIFANAGFTAEQAAQIKATYHECFVSRKTQDALSLIGFITDFNTAGHCAVQKFMPARTVYLECLLREFAG